MIYQYSTGYRGKQNAQAMGEACERIEQRGTLTPAALVDEARPEDSPIHDSFEWDDEVAAEKYRQSQASYYIRHLEAVPVGCSEPQRAFVPLTPVSAKGGTFGYMNITSAMASEPTRAIVLDRAMRELRAFREKYEKLDELAEVFEAIDKVEGESRMELAITAVA